jgi:hypothetical protein
VHEDAYGQLTIGIALRHVSPNTSTASAVCIKGKVFQRPLDRKVPCFPTLLDSIHQSSLRVDSSRNTAAFQQRDQQYKRSDTLSYSDALLHRLGGFPPKDVLGLQLSLVRISPN